MTRRLEAHGSCGAVSAPHAEATAAGDAILRAGGNAVEATVAMAAVTAVAYPHMSGIGGDGLWLIAAPGSRPYAIDAGGPAAQSASVGRYTAAGLEAIPARGPAAALTIPGTVAGWQAALDTVPARLPLSELLAPAIRHARDGWQVTESQARSARTGWPTLHEQPGFTDVFGDDPPEAGSWQHNPRLAESLTQLARVGLDDFYRGELASALAADLQAMDSPLGMDDLVAYHAQPVTPLSLRLGHGTAYNLPPPTQGIASLLILGIFEQLGVSGAGGFDHVHGLVEATKRAYAVRERCVTDPAYAVLRPAEYLDSSWLNQAAGTIDGAKASPWDPAADAGDTVWLGATDREGRTVSMLQSLYWGFGSGCASQRTGIVLQNRGHSFHLTDGALNRLAPGRRPFHTLNPALMRLDDGRTIAYGTMGGDGQPQIQAELLTRHVWFGQGLGEALAAPRWLLGRSWGEPTGSLRVENRLDAAVIDALAAAGHHPVTVDPYSEVMGHAGALVRHPDGRTSAASDPRSDGAAAAF